MRAPKTFEEGLQRLQELLAKMQDETTTLDQSVKLYAEAAQLIQYCNTALLRLLHKGFILLLITFLFHGEKPPYPAGSLIRAGLCQRCVDLFDL